MNNTQPTSAETKAQKLAQAQAMHDRIAKAMRDRTTHIPGVLAKPTSFSDVVKRGWLAWHLRMA